MKDDLTRVFCSISDPRVMKKFFNEIFTDSERKDLELRWALMRMLHEGHSQRDIAARLGISLCKITRGAKIVKQAGSVSRNVLDAPGHDDEG